MLKDNLSGIAVKTREESQRAFSASLVGFLVGSFYLFLWSVWDQLIYLSKEPDIALYLLLIILGMLAVGIPYLYYLFKKIQIQKKRIDSLAEKNDFHFKLTQTLRDQISDQNNRITEQSVKIVELKTQLDLLAIRTGS